MSALVQSYHILLLPLCPAFSPPLILHSLPSSLLPVFCLTLCPRSASAYPTQPSALRPLLPCPDMFPLMHLYITIFLLVHTVTGCDSTCVLLRHQCPTSVHPQGGGTRVWSARGLHKGRVGIRIAAQLGDTNGCSAVNSAPSLCCPVGSAHVILLFLMSEEALGSGAVGEWHILDNGSVEWDGGQGTFPGGWLELRRPDLEGPRAATAGAPLRWHAAQRRYEPLQDSFVRTEHRLDRSPDVLMLQEVVERWRGTVQRWGVSAERHMYLQIVDEVDTELGGARRLGSSSGCPMPITCRTARH